MTLGRALMERGTMKPFGRAHGLQTPGAKCNGVPDGMDYFIEFKGGHLLREKTFRGIG